MLAVAVAAAEVLAVALGVGRAQDEGVRALSRVSDEVVTVLTVDMRLRG